MKKLAERARANTTQRGVSLLEALVALVVMSFGMLALAAMQLSLSRAADVAKQRSEAVRIAQERIELARSFTSLAAGAGVDWTSLQTDVASPATVTTNTIYNVTVAMGGTVADAARPISVQVAWNDRAGEAQAVSLASVISQTDPRDPGFVGNPLPLNRPLKRPKNRNINIPIPAIYLGSQTSATQFDANYVAIFSNLTANVVQICNPNQANATASDINAAIASGTACISYNGYIVAGYVGRTGTSIVWPSGINHTSVTRNTAPTGTNSGIRCLYGDATNQNSGSLITADNGYKYYICVIPLQTPFTWSGTVRLGGVPTTGNYIVCRYQYTQTTVTANERNIQPYVSVDASIDEQNYLVTTSNNNTNGSIAGSTTACPSAMTVAGVSVGVVHQDCRTRNPARATQCPAAS
jgi:Tfp pilus assembly protein PilV